MIYFNLAVTHFYIEQYTTAKEYLISSIKIRDTEEKHYLLGEIYAKEGNKKAAIQEFTALINKYPHNIEYTIALANLYIVNKNFFKARNVLKTFFVNNPNERNNKRFAPYGILKFGL